MFSPSFFYFYNIPLYYGLVNGKNSRPYIFIYKVRPESYMCDAIYAYTTTKIGPYIVQPYICIYGMAKVTVYGVMLYMHIRHFLFRPYMCDAIYAYTVLFWSKIPYMHI